MIRLIAIIILGILLGIALLNLTNNATTEQQAAQLISNERPQGGDFTLASSKGTVSLHDFKGKMVLAYFGYTFCPDICPTNLGNLSVAYQQLSDAEKQKLQILFISVDPKRDTPQRLQEYVNYFNANMIGLTGQKSIIDEIAQRYGVIYALHQKNPQDEHYSVDHSAFTYLIDSNGKLVTQLPHATSPEMFVNTLRNYLKH